MSEIWFSWIRDLKRYTTANALIASTIHITSAICLAFVEKEFFVTLVSTECSFVTSNENILRYSAVDWTDTYIFSVLMTVAALSAVSSFFGVANANIRDRISGEDPTHTTIIRRERNRRFFDYAVTFSLMNMAMLLAVGESEIYLLLSVVALTMLYWFFNFLLETESDNSFHTSLYLTAMFFILAYIHTIMFVKYINVEGVDKNKAEWLLAINTFFGLLFFAHQIVQEYFIGLFSRSDRTTLYHYFALFYKLVITWSLAFFVRETIAKHNALDFPADGEDWDHLFTVNLIVMLTVFTILIICAHTFNAQLDVPKAGTKYKVVVQKDITGMVESNTVPVLGANFTIEDSDGEEV